MTTFDLIRTLDGDGLPAIVGRKDLLEILNFRNVIDHDVGPLGVLDEKVLVIVFRRIKPFEWIHTRHDWPAEYLGSVQLRYICLCNLLLRFIRIENVGSILRAPVRPLAIELRGVV